MNGLTGSFTAPNGSRALPSARIGGTLICDHSSRLSGRNSLLEPIFPAWYFGRPRHLALHLSRMANQIGAQLRWSSILTQTFLVQFSKVSTTRRFIFSSLRFLVTGILAGSHSRPMAPGSLEPSFRLTLRANGSVSGVRFCRRDST